MWVCMHGMHMWVADIMFAFEFEIASVLRNASLAYHLREHLKYVWIQMA